EERWAAQAGIADRVRHGGAGPLIAGAGADDDVIHGDAVWWEQRRGDGRRLLVPDVARDRGEVRSVGLETALRSAHAARAVGADGDVPELARRVTVTPNQLTVHHHPCAHAVRHRHIDEI